MGNAISQSLQEKQKSQSHVYKALSLKSDFNRYTENCLHQQFLKEFIVNKNKKGFDRKLNPFCPMHMKLSQNWMTCCFISPLMAIASPLYIFDNNQKFNAQCEVMVCNRKQIQPLKIKDAILIKKDQLCLIILQKPFLKVGWMGISFINSISQIQQKNIKIVNHPQKLFQRIPIHIQHIKQLNVVQKSIIKQQQFILKNKEIIGSILVRIQNEIPFIIGIQITENEALLFNQKLHNKIRSKVKQYIIRHKNQLMQQIHQTLFNDHRLLIECNGAN